jgi:hypothetical protein
MKEGSKNENVTFTSLLSPYFPITSLPVEEKVQNN